MPATFTQDTPECTFLNEVTLDNDGWAHLAPFGDFRGKGVEIQDDGTAKPITGIQRMDRQAAYTMLAEFNNAWNRIKRRFAVGVPIFLGHPDVPGVGAKYPDKSPKGMITALRVTEKGLECKPAFNNEGAELLEKHKLCFSTRWSTDPVGEENGMKVFRPTKLKSAGLVFTSRLPVEYLNHKPSNNMEKTVIIALLQKAGVEIANDAADEAVTAAIEQMGQKVTSFANDKTGLENQVKERDTKIIDLGKERDEARAQFANERDARVKEALDGAITSGKITAAERPDWERRLKADFANELPALGKLAPKVKVVPITAEMGGRKIEMANAADRRDFINKALRQVCHELNMDPVKDYDAAYAEVERRFPQVFQAMSGK